MKSYSKEVQKILSEATTKEKASILCRNADLIANKEKPILTEDEEDAIFKSIPTSEVAAFRKWVNIHDTIISLLGVITSTNYAHCTNAARLESCINMWEQYIAEEERINAIIDFVASTAPEALTPLRDKIKKFHYLFAEAKIDENGYLKIDIDGEQGLYNIIKKRAEECETTLIELKAVEVGFNEWVKAKRAKAFVFSIIPDIFKRAKLIEVKPYFTKAHLRKMEEQGYKITEAERKFAVYPDYDTAPLNEWYYKATKNKLNNLLK